MPIASTSSCSAARTIISGVWLTPSQTTSKPASRRIIATTSPPVVWPSRPIIETMTLIALLIARPSLQRDAALDHAERIVVQAARHPDHAEHLARGGVGLDRVDDRRDQVVAIALARVGMQARQRRRQRRLVAGGLPGFHPARDALRVGRLHLADRELEFLLLGCDHEVVDADHQPLAAVDALVLQRRFAAEHVLHVTGLERPDHAAERVDLGLDAVRSEER